MPEKIPVTMEAAPNIPAVDAYLGSTVLEGTSSVNLRVGGPHEALLLTSTQECKFLLKRLRKTKESIRVTPTFQLYLAASTSFTQPPREKYALQSKSPPSHLGQNIMAMEEKYPEVRPSRMAAAQ